MMKVDKKIVKLIYVVALFCLMSTSAYSSPAIPSESDHSVEVINETGIENSLRILLQRDYSNFKERFHFTGKPVALRDGGRFIDGWKDSSHTNEAAALLYYPDGRIYAAYFSNGVINYFGPKNEQIPKSIQIWKNRFSPTIKFHPSDKQYLELNKIQKDTSSDPSIEDQERLRDVASSIWGEQIASGWNMNADVGSLLGLAVQEIVQCSKGFSLVPIPPSWKPGWFWVASTASKIVSYNLGLSKNTIYRTCVVGVALDYRSKIEMASEGI